MDKKRLDRIKSEISSLRRQGGVAASELKKLLEALERTCKGTAWRNPNFPHLAPITLHPHPGDLNKFTKNGILDDMEADVSEWESFIADDGDVDA
ncbi:MAG: hypothetical protein ACXW5U_31755 [Thermoanaerobaculia bacterium]